MNLNLGPLFTSTLSPSTGVQHPSKKQGAGKRRLECVFTNRQPYQYAKRVTSANVVLSERDLHSMRTSSCIVPTYMYVHTCARAHKRLVCFKQTEGATRFRSPIACLIVDKKNWGGGGRGGGGCFCFFNKQHQHSSCQPINVIILGMS